ncbi:MAG: phage tail protein I [Vibrio sp.]
MDENYSLLPSNATAFEKALEIVTRSDMSSCIRDLWNIDKCPEEFLYVLAITLDVDEWDENWSETAKRQTLRDAYYVHSKKGTPESIRRVLRNAGYEEIRIVEGLSGKTCNGEFLCNGHIYAGNEAAWAMYRIYLEKGMTNEQSKQVRRLLEDTAPLHCELAGLHFEEAQFTCNGEIFCDGVYNCGVA